MEVVLVNPFASEAVYTRNCFFDRRTACKHAFRFLRHVAGCDKRWMTVFLGARGNTLRCPRTKGTAVSE